MVTEFAEAKVYLPILCPSLVYGLADEGPSGKRSGMLIELVPTWQMVGPDSDCYISVRWAPCAYHRYPDALDHIIFASLIIASLLKSHTCNEVPEL